MSVSVRYRSRHALFTHETLRLVRGRPAAKLPMKLPDGEATPVETVDRWLSAVSLVSAAEEAARSDFGPLNVVSVAASQAACVVMLGMIAGGGDDTPAKDETFLLLLDRAAKAVAPRAFPRRMRGELINLTDVRNLALHRGIAVAHETARRGAQTARRLLDALPGLLDEELHVDHDAGVATAVASRLEAKSLAEALVSADRSLREGDHLQSAAWLSRAWALAMHRAHLLTSGYQTSDRMQRSWRGLEAVVEKVAQATAINEVWISRFAIGLDPKSLIRLSEVLGSHAQGNPPIVKRYNSSDPSPDDVTWAIGRVTEVIYRLWAGGLLDLSAWERQMERAGQS